MEMVKFHPVEVFCNAEFLAMFWLCMLRVVLRF
jgi:hypothetical protein